MEEWRAGNLRRQWSDEGNRVREWQMQRRGNRWRERWPNGESVRRLNRGVDRAEGRGMTVQEAQFGESRHQHLKVKLLFIGNEERRPSTQLQAVLDRRLRSWELWWNLWIDIMKRVRHWPMRSFGDQIPPASKCPQRYKILGQIPTMTLMLWCVSVNQLIQLQNERLMSVCRPFGRSRTFMDEFPWNLVQTCSWSWWQIVMILVIQRLLQWVKAFGYPVKYLSIYWIYWHNV